MTKRAPPTIIEMAEDLKRHPDYLLDIALLRFRDTGNAFYAWEAISVCIKHKKAFPKVLLDYLEQCAERVSSDPAKKPGDLRKVLPWVLGFPNVFDPARRKRGPGNPLNPQSQDKRIRGVFALRFAMRIENGQEPLEAMRDACSDVFDGRQANADEKTLQHWLCEEFNLKKWISNADEWKAVTGKYHSGCIDFIRTHWEKISRDSAVQ
jgi:hypothetical protein